MVVFDPYLHSDRTAHQSTRELWIHQGEYILHILDEYGLSDCHPVVLPVDPTYPFLSDDAAAKLPNIPDLPSLYPKLIGELLYLSVCTRPDIAHAIQCLSQYLACPTPRLFAAAKCILCYLAGTVNYCLHYEGTTRTSELLGFSDADWATCPEDRVSITGYCWFYHGSVISHMSKKQSTQALSSTEAEYMAITSALQEGLWLRTFFQLLSIPFPTPIHLYVDNAGAIAVSREASNNHRTKHTKNIADILTKALPHPLFSCHVSGLSLVSH